MKLIPAYTKRFPAGSIIMQEGTPGHDMFILAQGTVALYRNYQKFNQVELPYPKTGGFFGETSLFLNKERSETAVAQSDAVVMVIDAKNANDIFSNQPDFAFSIMSQLCRKFDVLNTEHEKLIAKNAPETTKQAGQTSELFPEGHSNYNLPLINDNEVYLFKQKCKCPLCGTSFESLSVLMSRLRRTTTDKDMRVHYADIEPMYYDIISCPNCLYSTPTDMFDTASAKFSDNINQEFNKYLTSVDIKTGTERDSFTVFAGYYLAIRTIPICFDQYQLPLAGLWLKLSRIYKDCGDEKMYLYASEKAIENYDYVYQNFHISEKQSQQVCYIIGDLYERVKNYDKARNYFFLAKSNRDGTPSMKMQADKRLDELKLIMNQNQ